MNGPADAMLCYMRHREDIRNKCWILSDGGCTVAGDDEYRGMTRAAGPKRSERL